MIQSNAHFLDTTADSRWNAFKWLQLADAANLEDACKACVDRIVEKYVTACTVDTLQGLSPQTLMYMVEQMAAAAAPRVQPREWWVCSNCNSGNGYCCDTCGHDIAAP
jgi:hypothetical protein